MQDRRGARPSQVRPRPPSTGRPAPSPAHRRQPAPGRRQSYKPIERRRSVPLRTRLMLVGAFVAVVAGLVLVTSGGAFRVATAVGSTVDGMVAGLTATPTPRPSVPLVPLPPALARPEEPYTNQATVDIAVALPPDVAGSDSVVHLRHRIRDTQPRSRVVAEVPVGTSDTLVIPGVQLGPGPNDFAAVIVGPGGESDRSDMITYVLDLGKPPIEVRAPADGETINADAVTVSGKTQGRSDIIARNGVTRTAETVKADESGQFTVELPLGKGTNTIGLTVTDPAGNVAEHLLSVIRGQGKLTAEVTIDPPGVTVDKLPEPMTLRVVVTDPDEKPLPDANVTFTLSVPGIQVVTSEGVTAADGTAVFETTIPAGATPGEAVAAVLVRTEEHGETTDSLEFKIGE